MWNEKQPEDDALHEKLTYQNLELEQGCEVPCRVILILRIKSKPSI